MFRSSKLFVVVLVVLVFATAAFAFAAGNTMPTSTYAGEGSRVISGYTVSAPVYNLNALTPGNIDSVTFTLNAKATVVKVSLIAGSTPVDCTTTNAPTNTAWSCTTTGVTVSLADEFRVIALQ